MHDALLRLAGTNANSGAGTPQSIAAATTSGLLSENYLDRTAYPAFKLADLKAVFTFGTTVDSATANATAELQIVSIPKTSITTFTFVDGDVSTANDTITETAHGLPNGTRLTLTTSGTLPTGLATATNYYVVNAATDTFQLSLTPGGAAVNITAASGGGTHTVTWYPEILASSGGQPLERMRSGDALSLALNPLKDSQDVPLNRYVFARIVPSANLSAGTWFVDLETAVQSGKSGFGRSGFTIA